VIALASLFALASTALAKDSQFAFRALWVDMGSYNTPQAADKLLDQCRRAKVNVVIASVMVHGSLTHKSTHFLHKAVTGDEFDPLANLVQKAHASGIKVNAMYAVYYEGVKGLQPCNPDWLCSDIDGARMDSSYFLSPQIPGVNDYLLSVIADSLPYNIDGIQLDYIRYYGSFYDYSEQGRKPFIASHGFDPADLMDHAERIVAPAKDPFPVRVLHPQSHMGRPWETTWVESLMDRAGVGFGFITEKPANIDALRAPGALVISRSLDVSPEMTDAIERYIKRGGSLLWLDCPTVRANPRLAKVLGIKPENGYLPAQWRKLQSVGSHPLSSMVPTTPFKASCEYAAATDGGVIIAQFDSGQPAIIVNHFGAGRTALVCFNAGGSTGEGSPKLVGDIVRWLRTDSGVRSTEDPMAAKRAQWLKWRADQVTDLVRRVHGALKAKDPARTLSVAGGFGGAEYYTCMRDGRRWMAENLIDFGNPMDYFDSTEDLRYALAAHKADVGSAKLATIYPGLGLYTSKTVNGKKQPASRDAGVLRDQLQLLRDEGYRGFALFCAAQLSEDQIKVIAEAAK
jgi:uncharacterized lipoprotein YddW (UPF0748 family)